MSITLKAARVNRGLNQKEAAALIGVSLSTLQNYESGKSFPDVPVIESMETLFFYRQVPLLAATKKEEQHERCEDFRES